MGTQNALEPATAMEFASSTPKQITRAHRFILDNARTDVLFIAGVTA